MINKSLGFIIIGGIIAYPLFRLWQKQQREQEPNAVFKFKLPDFPVKNRESGSQVKIAFSQIRAYPTRDGWMIVPPSINFPVTVAGITSYITYNPPSQKFTGQISQVKMTNILKTFREGIQVLPLDPPRGDKNFIVRFPEVTIAYYKNPQL